MNIVVYCGSSFGDNPAYLHAAQELGSWIASEGHRLVFGGSNTGLMGVLADAVLASGGEVIGVELELFEEQGIAHHNLTQLVVVPTLAERRNLMLELGDAYVALPGGIGTLDEISEACTLARVGLHTKPCVFLNIEGYYDSMQHMCNQMAQHGFIDLTDAGFPQFAQNISELAMLLRTCASSSLA